MKYQDEFEVKVSITADQYHKLIHDCGMKLLDAKKQINHYFDTINFGLYNNNSMLRVRQTGDAFKLTLKVAVEHNHFVEYDRNISTYQLNEVLNFIQNDAEMKNIIEARGIKVDDLILLGTLITNRTKVPFEGHDIEIDHSIYNNIEDFEIEVESDSVKHAGEIQEMFCKKHGIPITGAGESKYGRFVESLKK